MIYPPAEGDDRPVWYVNRMLVVLRPRRPFADWANALADSPEPQRTLEELRAGASAFLIPIFDYMEDAWTWLEEHHPLLFETQLWQWTEEEAAWPSNRRWEVFLEWFDLELLAAPWDVVSGGLSSDPPPSAGDAWH